MVNDAVGDTTKNIGSEGEGKSVECKGVEDGCQEEMVVRDQRWWDLLYAVRSLAVFGTK